MGKKFNVTGLCVPEKHYMVNLDQRLVQIRRLVDEGDYFTINRARQYGKTTTLSALADVLSKDYLVISLDFQALGNESFMDETAFSLAFGMIFLRELERLGLPKSDELKYTISKLKDCIHKQDNQFKLIHLFDFLLNICSMSDKPMVLMIDEVDSATNNQVFLDFLAQLRNYYLERDKKGTVTFWSVILAGVYDVKNLKAKLRPDEFHKTNSPWNIATDFRVDLSFRMDDIAGMLKDYENYYYTGMNIPEIAALLYDYTAGYPFLVSKLCKLLDEQISGRPQFPTKREAWTKKGFLEAVKILLSEPNTLFESLINKLEDYPELNDMLR